MTTIEIHNDLYDIYDILCEHFGKKGRIHGMEITNRLLLCGQAGVDLRCIVFSYSWDHNRELAKADLSLWDGRTETTEDYSVRTCTEEDIIAAIRAHAEKYLLQNAQMIKEIRLIGEGEQVRAVLFCHRTTKNNAREV